MNIQTDAVIEIKTTMTPDKGLDVRKTVIGTTVSLTLALVATMQQIPGFADAVRAAIATFDDPKMRDPLN